jgi:hypothetical protein
MGPLPKGGYGLVAEKEEWLPEYVPPAFLQLVKTRVTLSQPGRLSGRVLWDEAPAPGAEVRVRGRDGVEQVTVAGEEGSFAFEGMRQSIYVLTARHEGRYATAEAMMNMLGTSSLKRRRV